MDPTTAAAIGSVVTVVIGAAVAAAVKWSREQHEQDKEIFGTTTEELRNLVTRLEAESIRHQQTIHKVRERCDLAAAKLAMCYQAYARAEERICAHEDLLAAHDIPFRKWVPRGDLSDPSLDIVQE